MQDKYIGKTVALTRLRAQVDGHQDVVISGLWEVVEYEPADFSVGFFSDFYVLESVDNGIADTEPYWAMVDPYELISQIDPKAFGKLLESEREMLWAAEDADRVENDAVYIKEGSYDVMVSGVYLNREKG